ncbi:MAG: FtsX-like permease family protein [Phycisphaerae bacterium]
MALPLAYNFRNLVVRRLSSSLTFAVVAVLVLVLTVLLSFAAGINASLAVSGSRDNLLVLKRGATAESTSLITPEEYKRLLRTQGIANGRDGKPLVSLELCVQTSIPRRDAQGNLANVAVRGVDPIALDVHSDVRILPGGRLFNPGQLEVIVGQAARDRYRDLDLGGSVRLGRTGTQVFKVVGIFTAAGGAFESEIWAPRTILTDAYGRHLISSAVGRLAPGADVAQVKTEVNGPAVQLDAKLEPEYYAELSRTSRDIVVLTSVLIVIMSVGAIFAVANTMFAAVDGRRREIAMLRTIGFSRGAIITSFVIESLLLSLAACGVGLAASFLFSGSRQDFLSDTTWTVLAYELRVTPGVIVTALLVSTGVGVFGALAPALRASRVRVIEALRKV